MSEPQTIEKSPTPPERASDGTRQPPQDPIVANNRHGGEIHTEQLVGAGRANGNSHKSGTGHDHGEEEIIPRDLPKPSRMTIIGLVSGFVLLLVALFLIGLIPEWYRKSQTQADAEARANDNPVVSTTQPFLTAANKDVTLPCDVRANQDTSIYPRSNGYLKKWYFDIQAHVKKGDLLADIDTPDVDAQLQQSRASLDQSKAAVETAKSNLDLAQKTLNRYLEAQKTNPGAITQEDLDTRVSTRDQAASALKQAQANVGAARADVQRMEVMQGFEKIYAPFDGVVTFRGYDNGALLNPSNLAPGQEMFRLQQTDLLRVFVSVPQTYSTSIHTGQPAYLKVRNYGDREFEGTVARAAGSLDPATRTMNFELDFPNPRSELYPGMYGQVRLGVTQTAPVLTIPSSALVFNAGGTQVAVVKDNKARFQKIAVGRDLGTQLEIVDGLTPEDVVVTNPGERLTDGIDVQIANAQGQKPDAGAKPEKVASKD